MDAKKIGRLRQAVQEKRDYTAQCDIAVQEGLSQIERFKGTPDEAIARHLAQIAARNRDRNRVELARIEVLYQRALNGEKLTRAEYIDVASGGYEIGDF